MGWAYWPSCMSCTWRGTPRIALSRDASACSFFQIWHLASHPGNLPALGDLSRWSLLSLYNIWKTANISWHAAKRTSPDPLRSWMDQNLAPVTKSRCKNLFFVLFDLDLWPWFTKNRHAVSDLHIHTKNQVRWSIGRSRRGGYGQTDGQTDRIRPLLWMDPYFHPLRSSAMGGFAC